MKNRSKVQREQDLVVIADLYRRGWSLRQIAAEITARRPYSLSYSMVKVDLDRVLSQWREQQVQYVDNFITIEFERIESMKSELMQEYIRSKQPTKLVSERRKAMLDIPTHIHNNKKAENLAEDDMDSIFDTTPKLLPKNKEGVVTGLDSIDVVFTSMSSVESVYVDQNMQMTENLGNPRYLELIAKLIDQQAKLLAVGVYGKGEVATTSSVIVVNMPAPQALTLEDQDHDE